MLECSSPMRKIFPPPTKIISHKNHRTHQKTKQNLLTWQWAPYMCFLPAISVINLRCKNFAINKSSGNIKFTTSHKSYTLMHSYPHDSSHALPRHHLFQSTVNRQTNFEIQQIKAITDRHAIHAQYTVADFYAWLKTEHSYGPSTLHALHYEKYSSRSQLSLL